MGIERFNKREIFYGRDNKEKSPEDDFVFDITNVDFRDERTIKYLDDLKETDLGTYYNTLEQLADLKFLDRKEEDLNEEKKDFMNKIGLIRESVSYEIKKGDDDIWRVNGMTYEEWKDFNKEDGIYR
jgi:hypothetical protein